ncbi:MAG: pilus assembly protein TadG-related protein [Dehalococcoidia bacterium]|nr:pilus assembly protein TadG-related protein [Dehalococcoidia bacterium]
MRIAIDRLQAETGQVLVMVALMMLGVVSAVGLVGDGGLVFAQRRDLQNVADAAAAAGAMQIDEVVYRSTGQVTLDEQLARAAAARYLEDEGGLDYVVAVRQDRVEVSVSRQASTGFLRVIGIDGVNVTASASAEPRYGIESAGP